MTDLDARHTPTEIRQHGPDQLAIRWSDGIQTRYDVRALRMACRCAHCIDEWTGEQRLDPGSVANDVRPTEIRSIGRYAIGIDWSDGHSTGIYSFEQLRELSPPGDAVTDR